MNGAVFTLFSLTSFGQFAPLSFLGFNDVTIAWGMGILVAFVSNFLCDKYWVFKQDVKNDGSL